MPHTQSLQFFLVIIMSCGMLSSPFANIIAQSTKGLPSDSTYFPIAVWLQNPSNATAYKVTGINLYIGLWEGPNQSQLDQLLSVQMPVFCDQNSFALNNLDTYGTIIAGWMHGDEPDNAQWNGSSYDPCIEPDTIKQRYAQWKANDPTRPVYLNLGQGVSYIEWVGRGTCTGRTDMYPEYIQGCDIVSYDIYPVNSEFDIIEGNLWYVPKGVDSLRMWSQDAKPVWCWIECTSIDSERKPTPYQVKTEVWMAIIHGAKGFGYFCHSWYPSFREAAWLGDQAMKDAITAINQRITALAPVLNRESVADAITVTSSNTAVPVDIMVKSHGEATYLFAVAMRDDTTTAQFSIAGMSGNATAEVLDENRTIPVVAGSFSDAFDGYAVHLYKINSSVAILPVPGLSRRGAMKGVQIIHNSENGALLYNTFGFSPGTCLNIYSPNGILVRTQIIIKRTNRFVWDGKDNAGCMVARGVYIVTY